MWATVGFRSEGRARHDHGPPSDVAWVKSELEIERPHEREQNCLHPNFTVFVMGTYIDTRNLNLLDDGEAVTDTRVSTRKECEQVAEDARDRFDGFGNGLPTFWPASNSPANLDADAAQSGRHLPELVSVLAP